MAEATVYLHMPSHDWCATLFTYLETAFTVLYCVMSDMTLVNETAFGEAVWGTH